MNKVAVLIPHFNNFKGLQVAIRSIDTQEEVDVIVVDDGSKKNKIDETLLKKDFLAKGEIIVLYLKENQGIEHALNHGLDYIIKKGYTFIARLDCSDQCVPLRFKKQQDYLEQHPNIYLLGTFCIAIDTQGKELYKLKLPETTHSLQKKMYYNCMFIHPTVMFNSKALAEIGVYPLGYDAAEDYAFFFKFVKKYDVANLAEFLVKIEINDTGISAKKRNKQLMSRIRIIKENFYWGYYPISGLIRTFILLLIPRKILNKIKSFLS